MLGLTRESEEGYKFHPDRLLRRRELKVGDQGRSLPLSCWCSTILTFAPIARPLAQEIV